MTFWAWNRRTHHILCNDYKTKSYSSASISVEARLMRGSRGRRGVGPACADTMTSAVAPNPADNCAMFASYCKADTGIGRTMKTQCKQTCGLCSVYYGQWEEGVHSACSSVKWWIYSWDCLLLFFCFKICYNLSILCHWVFRQVLYFIYFITFTYIMLTSLIYYFRSDYSNCVSLNSKTAKVLDRSILEYNPEIALPAFISWNLHYVSFKKYLLESRRTI